MIELIRQWKQNSQAKKDARNALCDQFIERTELLLKKREKLLSDHKRFVDPEAGTAWSGECDMLRYEVGSHPERDLRKASNYETLIGKQQELVREQRRIQDLIHLHNENVASLRIQAAYALIGDVEGRKLDRQQMQSILKESHNHLVIAGAGTGKTTTIIGKIKYLLKTGKCRPEDILVLSFTNASATEMSQRINAETGVRIQASTFHKLGLNIISAVEGVVPKITQINLRKFVREQLAENMKSNLYLLMLSEYLTYYRTAARSEFDFKTAEEYNEYLMLNPPMTINHEQVKSYGELDIANFLAQNDIAYVYEQEYEHDTRTSEYAQYYPDFYLPEYKIYIEYYGINRNGEVPAYFKGRNGKNASQTYQDQMAWKRSVHAENGTRLLACYAYEKMEGSLLENLARRLQEEGVILRPKAPKDLWNQVTQGEDSVLDGLCELFETVINLMKSNNDSIDSVRARNRSGDNRKANELLLKLLEPIFGAYVQHLISHGEIDFNDMINLATKYVMQGKYSSPFRYVIVDEYQDISKARYSLLNSMRKTRDYDLFCVGDDWQSIYRFAGSDIGFILNFPRYWGACDESRIETTYRFSQSLIDISGGFVMNNPAQKKKLIRGSNEKGRFALGEINGFTERNAVEFMAQKLEDLPKDSTVFFLGRYSFDGNILRESGLYELQYNNHMGVLEVRYPKRADLKMCFMSVHKSKGLQADYVFVLNNKKSRMGFPSKIQDAPILDLLLEGRDEYPYAEERRLFYVALTRAKKKVFLLTVKGRESAFVEELRARYGTELKKERFECPLCGGVLVKRSGKFGEFFGCSNYKSGGCRYTRNIKWTPPAQMENNQDKMSPNS